MRRKAPTPNTGFQRTARLRLAAAEAGSLARQRWFVPVIVLSWILGCAAPRQPYQAEPVSPEARARIDKALAQYRDNLTFSVRLAQPLANIGRPIDLSLVLTNNSDKPIIGCVGSSRTFAFDGSAASRALVHSVDHPYCKSRFRIDPHGDFQWRDAVEVPEIGKGPARLRVSQSIVYAGDCDHWYGCRDVDLNAAPVAFTITEVPE